MSDRHTKLNEHDKILDEMITIMPIVLNEMKRNGHLKTWISLSGMVNDGSFPIVMFLHDIQNLFLHKD